MSENKDTLKVRGINSKGYGFMPKLVMQDPSLTIEAKAIYGYFSSYAGAGETAFPSVGKTIKDLKVSRDRYYKHRKHLEDRGYISIEKVRTDKGDFSRNVYTLNNEVACTGFTDTRNPDTDNPTTRNKDTNSNSSNSNSINSNSNKNSRNSGKPKYDDNSPYMKLAKRLQSYLKNRNPEQSEPNWQTWADDFRKTAELDNKSLKNMVKILDWCQQDSFWRKNVMSPAKFRKQYDKLAIQMNEETGQGGESYGGLEF